MIKEPGTEYKTKALLVLIHDVVDPRWLKLLGCPLMRSSCPAYVHILN